APGAAGKAARDRKPHSERVERGSRQAGGGARGRLVQNARPNGSTTMEFTALFLAVTVVMVVAWWGTRTLALALFAATLLASIATYLHHASDVLKLSF